MSERISVERTIAWHGNNGTRVLRKSDIRPPRVRDSKVARGFNVKRSDDGTFTGVNLTIERGGAVEIEEWTKSPESSPVVTRPVAVTSPEQINDRVPSLTRRLGPISVYYKARNT